MNIPYLDHGGSGLPLHFLHANGYPPACYQGFLTCLRGSYQVFGMLLRPLWPGSRPDEIKDWNPLSDDLADFLDAQKRGPVIGVGHSIGAIVSLRLALREPGRFRALVMLDPVLFHPGVIVSWNILRRLGFGHRVHPLIRGAQKRRRTFDDLEAAFRGYRRRPVFRHFSDQALRDYIAGMTRPREQGGYELVYSPEWESRIYYTGVWRDLEIWRALSQLEIPTILIRGEETDTFLPSAARLVKKIAPRIRVDTLPASTHLLPLERPGEVFEIMQSFLKEKL